MEYNEQYSSNPRSPQGSSNMENMPSLDPFVSAVLARLGLEDNNVAEGASVELLLMGLNDAEWQVRAVAARKLGARGEKAGVAPLVAALLNDKVAEVKIAVARALGELADYASIEPLIAALDDPSDEIKAAVAWALGELGERVPISASLENLLNNDDVSVRAAAVRALGELKKRTPVHILVAALKDPSWRVREVAALALGEQRNHTLQDAIANLLDDESEFVRKAAIRALAMIREASSSKHSTPPVSSGDAQGDSSPTYLPNGSGGEQCNL